MLSAALLLDSCVSRKFSIGGTLDEELPDSLYLVYVSDSDFVFPEVPADTVLVKDGSFSWETIDYSEARYLNIQAISRGTGKHAMPMQMVLVPGEDLSINVHDGYFEITEPCSEFYRQAVRVIDSSHVLVDELRGLFAKSQSSENEGDSLQAGELFEMATAKLRAYESFPFSYIRSHSKEEGAVLALALHYPRLLDSINLVPAEIQNGRCANIMKHLADNRAKQLAKDEQLKKQISENTLKTAEGNIFTDFVSMYNKRVYKLSDYVGTGKYVLADFWASWCGPCRKIAPEVLEIYNQYHGNDFDVVGIAVNDKPENSLAAIEKDGIPYPQIVNSWNVSAETYGFKEIPYFILFGPDGTILKRSTGLDEIRTALKEIMD